MKAISFIHYGLAQTNLRPSKYLFDTYKEDRLNVPFAASMTQPPVLWQSFHCQTQAFVISGSNFREPLSPLRQWIHLVSVLCCTPFGREIGEVGVGDMEAKQTL